MGTLWYRADFEDRGVAGRTEPKDPDRLFYPLSMLISPNAIYKQLKEDFENRKARIEGYKTEKNEEIVDTGEMTYEEYQAFMEQFEQGMGYTG